MKDFSMFNTDINAINLRSGIKIFEKQLKGLEGHDIEINDIPTRGVIYNHLNDMSEKLEDRALNVRLDTDIKTGYYVKNEDDYYLVMTGIDNHYYYKNCKIRRCNQKLIWKGLKAAFIPCYITNSSYGSKGEIHNITQISDFDARAVILVGVNEYTNQIRNGMRFIFNHSKDDVYEVTKKTTAYNSNGVNGYMQLTCKYVKWVQEDDFVNNIAFNSFLEDNVNPSVDITLIGEEFVLTGSSEIYTINNATNVTFKLDDDTIAENNAEIVSQDGTSCVVKMLKDIMCQIECRDSLGNILYLKTIYGVGKL
jgi:hypothetical protein